MKLEIGTVFCLLAVVGLSRAYPFPQNNEPGQNHYLPQIIQGKSTVVSSSFNPIPLADLESSQKSGNQGLSGSEIINLTPPLQQAQVPVESDVEIKTPASVSTIPQGQETQDSYSNFGVPASPSDGGSVKIASALVNPHEYGETVPGEFSSLNTYASYQNYQAN